ncbi:peptide ABC transporter substrate-binding protein [Psittacicella gerlachiana]|uniref:Solute-binding protein family 5 domain-containing protein n=1 Tax=Psittacicella gerlachiana TaxID=2028574 RepID=A0A3A1YB71_9GAMM|nr:peptide ABC transporter substrate-binding protein [Psittacicella gerlachiana]RIY34440.1 hypothetical protein CKF59_05450 [Psittacicella gerlachiana]
MQSLWKKSLAVSLLATAMTATGLTSLNTWAAEVPAGVTLATKQTLQLQIGDNPKTLDPNLTSENVGTTIVDNLFEGLTTYDAEGKIVPAGAVSWTHTPDNKVWTFKLRQDAKWSDGTPVTAQDYVASWRRLVDPNTASEYSFYLADLGVVNAAKITDGKEKVENLGVQALDDYTLQVTLETPVPWFIEATPLANLAPVPSKLLAEGKWPNFSNLVSNGPYVLTYAMPNEKYVVTKNPQYYNASKTIITEATFNVVRSSNDAYKRFQAGDLDAFLVENPQLKRKLKEESHDQYKVVISPGANVNFYTFNLSKPPFNNLDVRKALLLAVDTKEMAQKVFLDNVIPTSLWVSPAIPGANSLKQSAYFDEPITQRVKQAQELLAQAGYSASNPLKFTINYNSSDTNKMVAIMLQAQFKKTFGNTVDISINNREWSTFLSERLTGAYTFYRMGWNADYYEPSTFYSIWTSTNPTNTGGYKSVAYDKLFQDLYTTDNANQRLELYQKMNDLLNEDVVGIPLFSPLIMSLTVNNLHGYVNDDTVRRLYNMYLTK